LSNIKICKICNTACGFSKYGTYTRWIIYSLGEKIRTKIQRYLCKSNPVKGKSKTFSLLPEEAIPYHQYSLQVIMIILDSFFKATAKTNEGKLNKLYNQFPENSHINNIELSHIRHFEKTITKALNRFNALTAAKIDTLKQFINYCREYEFNGRTTEFAVTEFFYVKFKRFLFGEASQHRCYNS
jgi:Domain of unknown function (DUF6431)